MGGFWEEYIEKPVRNTYNEVSKGVGNVITVAVKPVGDILRESGRFVGGDIGEGLEKFGTSADNFLLNPLNETGQWFNEANRTASDPVMYLDREILGGNVDKYTGGLLTTVKNASGFALTGDLLQGKNVGDNLLDIGRVTAILYSGGAFAGAGAGLSIGSAYATTMATANITSKNMGDALASFTGVMGLPPMVGGLIQNVFNPRPAIQNSYADSTPDTVLFDTKGKFIPIIIIATVVIGAGIIILSTKKKRNKK